MLDADTISMLDQLFQPLHTFAVNPGEQCHLTREVDRIKQALLQHIDERTAQLAAANQALRTAEARQRALLNAVPDIVLRMSTDGTYLDFSDPHNKLRLPKERLIGSNVRDWSFSPEALERVLAAYQRAVDTGEIQTEEYSVLHEGDVLSYESRIMRCGPNEVVSIARDITTQKQAEATRSRQIQLALFRAEFTEAMDRPGPLPTILTGCSEVIVRHLDAAFVRIWLFAPEQSTLELVASAGQYTHLDGEHSRIPLGLYKIGQIAQSRQPYWSNQVSDDPNLDQAWASHEGMVAFAGYPLIVEDRLVGVLGMFARQPLPAETREVLGSTAAIIAQGVERRRTEQALRDSETRFRSVFEQAAVGITYIGLDGRFILVNQKLCDIVGYPREEMLNMSFQSITHPDDLPLNLEYIGQLINGEISHFNMEKRYRRPEGTYVWTDLTAALVRNAAGEPIHFIGVLEDIAKRKQVETTLEQRAAQLALINDIGSKIAAELDLDSLFHRAARLVHEKFGYQHVSLYLLEDDVARLKAIAGLYEAYFAADHTQKLSQGIIGWVGTHGEKIVAGDIAQEQRYISLIPQRVLTRSELCLPIKIGEKTVGVLDIQSAHLHAFSANDVLAMEILSDQIAVALANARLYQVAQQELTERRRIEAELRLSEQRLRQIIDLVPHFIFAKDIEGKFILANQATAEVYGTTVDDLLTKTDADYAQSAAEVVHFRSDDLEVIQNGQAKVIPEEYITDWRGQARVLQTSKIPFTFSGTSVPSVLGVAIDITERKRAEEALRQGEQRLRQIIDLVPHLIFAKDVDGRLILANQAFADLNGVTVDTLLQMAESDWIQPPSELQKFRADDLLVLQEGQPKIIPEEPITDVHGQVRLLQTSKIPFTFSGTTVPAILGVSIDITERKRAEEALRISEQRLRQIIDLMPHSIFAKAEDGRLILANRALAESYGGRVEDILGKTKAELGHSPEQVELWRQQEQESLRRNQLIVHPEEIFIDAQGNRRIYQATTLPFTFSGTDSPAVLGVITDISDLKRAEDEVRKLNAELEQRVQERTSQLAAINRELEAFCYSVSHDLRAPLRAVNGFSQALFEDYGQLLNQEGQNYLQRVRSASQRMGLLIDDLLNLSQVSRHQIQRSPVNLSEMAQAICAELSTTQPQRQVEWKITPDLWVEADANLIQILLSNLLDNAWKYTSHHATACIELGVKVIDHQPTYFVKDDGAGFDMTYIDKLFGAFQRLHRPEEFEGTGIGLATVERIVHRHGGRVCAEAAVEQGATFYFTLPASKE